jgi:predicted transcriptional regulator
MSVGTLKRSILTEKVARRGYHVSREYQVDPLHALLVRDVMRAEVDVLWTSQLSSASAMAYADETLRQAADRMVAGGYLVLGVVEDRQSSRLIGMVSQSDLLKAHERVLVEERHRERPLTPRRLVGGFAALLPAREPVS